MKGNPIDRDIFRKAKVMLKSGMANQEIAEVLEISTNSVKRIDKADSYEAHKANVAHLRKKPEEQTEVQKPKPTAADHYQLNRLYEQQKAQTEQLAQLVGYMRECAKGFSELLDLLR